MLLSVVVPTYNRADMVENLLKNFQLVVNDDDCELIVVDDASGPGEQSKLEALASHYKDKVQFLFLSENSGGGFARNAGAKSAHGRWLWFFDDDDVIDEASLTRLLAFIKKEDTAAHQMIFLTYNEVFDDGSNNKVIPKGHALFDQFRRYGHSVNTSCLLISRELFDKINGWDSALVAGQDTDIFLRAAQHSDAYVLNDVQVDVFFHEGARITSNPKKQVVAKYQFLKKHWRLLNWKRRCRYVITMALLVPYIKKMLGR